MLVLISICIGGSSALFLKSLEYAEILRTKYSFIVFALPFAGLGIVYLYQRLGSKVERGTNQILKILKGEKEKIPLSMGVSIFFTTIATHIFGGSAGREGTALQMGASFSSYFQRWLGEDKEITDVLILAGIAGGFSAVFGTPVAAIIFTFEMTLIGFSVIEAILPCIIVSFLSNYCCLLFDVHHTSFQIVSFPIYNFKNIAITALCSIAFGWVAFYFVKTQEIFKKWGRVLFKSDYVLIFVGGVLIASSFYFIPLLTQFSGLGLDSISKAFEDTSDTFEWLLKLLYTTFTLAIGFKGGEVTPLFFIGATLGNAMTQICEFSPSFLAGMGMVAVFASATNTPLASTILALELFGYEGIFFYAFSCFLATYLRPQCSIYSEQLR